MFSTAPGHRIMLIFDQFDLEVHSECAYDHVAVYDGESAKDPPMGRYCGSKRPLTLLSSFNMLYLLFHSDKTNEKRGFNATHSTGKSLWSIAIGAAAAAAAVPAAATMMMTTTTTK